MTAPRPIHISDYRAPDFYTQSVALTVALDPEKTRVTAKQKIVRQGSANAPLVLNGENLELEAVRVNNRTLAPDEYEFADDLLTIADLPDEFELEIQNTINPSTNSELMGLYMSGGIFCTQCEAEGFRRITCFQDRPDVLATYSVRIEAEQAAFPVLLSNGNLVGSGSLEGGRHFAEWHDPHPKPPYLFALVAGELARLEDTFTTQSGRAVDLHIYASAHNLDQCHFAMDALKRSMRWDEEIYNLEYDLDLFQIVAVDDFNMGAMENKGLNIFNAAAILVRQDIATDQDFMIVERIIAHEYFHNWTGNRVTCRDWFQLTLKEGLTVFRDQQFSSDMHSEAVKRIGDVMLLREGQFTEDSGPLAHPIRPQSYLEINNFYTRTVYEKGAEVIRMLKRLIGEDAYYRGIALYFERHDGSAATCEDFVAAMADASGQNLDQFMRWYARAGTPTLQVTTEHDPKRAEFSLHIEQKLPAIKGQVDTGPLHMPVEVGLLSADGIALPLRLRGEAETAATSRVLSIKNDRESFVFADQPEPPIPSILRGFTAPVRLEAPLTAGQYRTLMAHDEDPFVRWSAAQKLYLDAMLARVSDPARGNEDLDGIVDSGLAIINDTALDPALVSALLVLPSENLIGQELEIIDVDRVAAARKAVKTHLIHAWAPALGSVYERMQAADQGTIDTAGIACRALKNRALTYLIAAGEHYEAALRQYHGASGMTDRLAALWALTHEGPAKISGPLLQDFYERYESEPLVINKWFGLQAAIDDGHAVERVGELIKHPAFTGTNPNRIRAVFGSFATASYQGFHRADGAGYRLIADHGLEIDGKNPQVAARLLIPLGRWRRYDESRANLMRAQLERLRSYPELSKDSLEIVERSLA